MHWTELGTSREGRHEKGDGDEDRHDFVCNKLSGNELFVRIQLTCGLLRKIAYKMHQTPVQYSIHYLRKDSKTPSSVLLINTLLKRNSMNSASQWHDTRSAGVKPYPEKTRALFKVLVIALFKDKDRNCFCSVYSYKDRSGTEHEKEFEVHLRGGWKKLIPSDAGLALEEGWRRCTSHWANSRCFHYVSWHIEDCSWFCKQQPLTDFSAAESWFDTCYWDILCLHATRDMIFLFCISLLKHSGPLRYLRRHLLSYVCPGAKVWLRARGGKFREALCLFEASCEDWCLSCWSEGRIKPRHK